MKPVLICGGVGKKMWPLSREKFPKHFLPLFRGKSLFQINYETLLKKFKPEEIFIQTNVSQAKTALEQAKGIPLKNCFLEPELRDTGPAVGLMALRLSLINPDEPFVVIQTDVLRNPGENFLKMIEVFEELVNKEEKLVTGGIRPNYVVMGVDYLVTEETPIETSRLKIFKMKKWLGRDEEKGKIEKYFKIDSLFVHANHYSWTPKMLLEAFKKLAPDWYRALEKIKKGLGSPNEDKIIKLEYAKMERAPIERVTKFVLSEGYVIEVPFEWTDFGTWESFFRYKIRKGEYEPGENFLGIDSQNSQILKDPKKFVAIIGVEDVVIIDTQDGLLVCHKDKTGLVEKVVEYLREKKKKEYL